ncbi:MAG: HAD family phosphatase [Rhodobacteraceae bacterium]|nr:HAD family phosphatase [Paracoccaceae bacterium]
MTENRTPFRGALFDMDGLLLDSERACLVAFGETVAGFGLPPMPEVALACIGLRRDGVKATIAVALGARVDSDTFYTAWGQRISKSYAHGIPVKAGVVELLEALKTQGTPCAVATSTQSDLAEGHLQRAGLRGYFKAVIGGDQVTLGKPAPEIYLKAAETLGVSAAACAAFEDSDPGTLAAIASRATVVQVPDVNAPSAALLAKGHVIADNVLDGAMTIGLIRARL